MRSWHVLMYNANTRQVQYVIMQIINYSILVVIDINNSAAPRKNSLHLVFFYFFYFFLFIFLCLKAEHEYTQSCRHDFETAVFYSSWWVVLLCTLMSNVATKHLD